MKVFISWSGEVSFEVAKVLKEWIPCVIQDVQPYFSSEDIDKGARWSTDIAKELEAASFGILCVTKDNLESKWLNFEAGALSKAIDKAKVCPLLFRLKPSDISESPILQFQMANVSKNDIYKLFKSVNNSLGDAGLDDARLDKVFNMVWPQMEKDFDAIKDNEDRIEGSKVEKDSNMEIFEEMLDLLRSQQMMLKNPEKILPMEYVQSVILQSQKESSKIIKNMVPQRIIVDLEHSEMELNQLLSEASEVDGESTERIRNSVRSYMVCTRRLLKFLGIMYPSFILYRGEE